MVSDFFFSVFPVCIAHCSVQTEGKSLPALRGIYCNARESSFLPSAPSRAPYSPPTEPRTTRSSPAAPERAKLTWFSASVCRKGSSLPHCGCEPGIADALAVQTQSIGHMEQFLPSPVKGKGDSSHPSHNLGLTCSFLSFTEFPLYCLNS